MMISRLSVRSFFVALTLLSVAPMTASAQDVCCDLTDYDQACCDVAGCDFSCDACGSTCETGCLDSTCMTRLAGILDDCALIKRSDRCFDDFISPMINFVFFEDARNVTELRPIFVSHSVPDTIGAGVAAGGSIQLFATQFRIALTDRLSLIAVKDGYIFDNTDGALDTLLDDGWADVSAGLKYNFLRDPCSGTLASAGFTYEIPLGSDDALQSVGDGEFHIFVTGGQRLLDGNAHVLSSVGYRFPVDDDVQNSAVHWSNHLDVRLSDRLYAVTEVAWWHWTDESETGLALGVAGQDLFNLSSTNVLGNDLVTQNVGLKFKPRRNVEAGVAYEFPLTEFKDVIEDRVQLDLIVRY